MPVRVAFGKRWVADITELTAEHARNVADAQSTGRAAEPSDTLDQRRDQAPRDVVAPAGIDLDFRSRYQHGSIATVLLWQKCIVLSMQHQSRHAQLLQELDAMA